MKCLLGQEEILQPGSRSQIEEGEADGVHMHVGLVCKDHLPKIDEATNKARVYYSNAGAIRKTVKELLGL